MGEVSLFGNTSIADEDALLKSLEDTQDEGARAGDVNYMSFSGKRGKYSLGIDKREPQENENFLVAINMFEMGWIGWKGGKPIGKRMATASQPRVQQPDSNEGGPFDENKGEGWFAARAITARSFDTGEQIYFSNSSKSGVAAMADLQRAVVQRMKSGQPCWPVVNFGIEEFESQGFKNFKPTMEPANWLTTEQVQALADESIDPNSMLGNETTETTDEPEVRKRRL